MLNYHSLTFICCVWTILAEKELMLTEVGSNDSYYNVSLSSGLLHLQIRLPAEVLSDQLVEAVSPATVTAFTTFKWFQSARAGHFSSREILQPFPGLESRLDDGQLHDFVLERTPDQGKCTEYRADYNKTQRIRISIDDNVVFFQPLSFGEIRAGFLEIQRIVLASYPMKAPGQEAFKGQITHAVLQVDDTKLNILEFAAKSLHGFEINGTRPTACETRSASLLSLALRRVFLLLRLPTPPERSTPTPLFNKLPLYASRIRNWQQIEITLTSHTEDALLFLLFHRLGQPSSPLLGVELRRGSLWLVTRKHSWKIHVVPTAPLRVGAGKIPIPGEHEATVIAAGDSTLEYFVAIDGEEFRPAFEAELVGVLESAVEGLDNETPFGRNLLLGGSNWTAEGEFGRDLTHLWSGLGRRKQFAGCIHRLVLNGESVDFDPIVRSRLKHLALDTASQLQLGCQPPRKCTCQNGGVCEDGECNCLNTAFTGEVCQKPAKILAFDRRRQLRMRFPLPHRLESSEIRFAFRTQTRNATLLSTYSQGAFSTRINFFGLIQPDGMRIDLMDGRLTVVVILDGQPNTLGIPTPVADDEWHVLSIVRTASLLRVHLDGTLYEKGMPEGEVHGETEHEATIFVCLGGPHAQHQSDVIEADNLIMRIQEIQVGRKTTSTTFPFVGHIRHFTFNGVDPLMEPEYLVETPKLKMLLQATAIEVHPAITLKTPDCFLRLPRLNIYGAFQVIFALKSHQEDGVVLFNSGGDDFLAVELVRSQLTISFDMGHGATLQHQRIGRGFLSDGNWHQIIISRNGQMDEYLRIKIKSEFGGEEDLNLTIPSVTTARNFNFNEPLYLGGIPNEVRVRFAEKIISKHGLQGCIGGFGVNNQTQMDLEALAKATMGKNRTSAVCKWQVVRDCLDRPPEAPTCTAFAHQRRLPYCLNGGVCLQVWTSLRCSCEMTTFTGNRCHLPGTSLKFGRSKKDHKEGPVFVKFTYLHDQQNTNREEIALGLQVTPAFSTARCSLLYVDTKLGNVDFLHIYLDAGIANLVFNMGGGVIQMRERRRRLNDGNYHRIRVFRHGLATLLEVDELTTKHVSNGPLGEQFNDQQSIWLGFAPNVENYTTPFSGVLSGAFYNGLPLSDLAAGLSHRADVHVTRHAEIQYLANFKITLQSDSFFQQLPDMDLGNLEGTSYHDDETALNNVESLANTVFVGNDTENADLQYHREWIQFPPRTLPSTDYISPLPLQSHVNTWLFICLGAAGIALVASLFFLLFHCLQRRRRQEQNQQRPVRLMEHESIGRVREHSGRAADHFRPLQETEVEPVSTAGHPPVSYVAFSESFLEVLDTASERTL